ncbi:MAG TPA: metal ABC transporter permease [Thermotogota bacterium]|nr:metal ABC transporter permease [Thermotogota bacterium]HRW92262.1 metal ABC transporter permease [Thermotogota bacterium]
MFEALFSYGFLQNAFWSVLLASVVCGIVGTIIIQKHWVMMSGGIAHTAFGGIGMGYFFGFEPILGALLFASGSSVAIAAIKRHTNTGTDTLVGMLWALGMAAGILFISFTPGYPPDMASYLFGDILTVTPTDLWMMLVLASFVVVSIFSFFNMWKSFLFDEEYAFVSGLPTAFLEYFLFFLVALTVIVLIRVVGIILVIAMLTAPSAIAGLFSKDLRLTMVLAGGIGMVGGIAGLWLSYTFDLASGATIILLLGGGYFVSVLLHSLGKKLAEQTKTRGEKNGHHRASLRP